MGLCEEVLFYVSNVFDNPVAVIFGTVGILLPISNRGFRRGIPVCLTNEP